MNRALTYGSVCSGIEAATVAWHPLGWRPAWFAEIDKFPSAVLAHHYPEVRNFGDFTSITRAESGAIDVLVGGTPCQAFSVAGQRAGLADPRGNLTLEFLRLADRLRPKWLVWENVPGVLSIDGGRTFGTILGTLGKLGYGFAYRVLDAQYFGVPQRRRRVFLVGRLGDWRSAAKVLFERESVRGYPAPSREAREATTRGVEVGPSGGRYTEISCTLDARAKDGATRNQIGMLAHTLKANSGRNQIESNCVAPCLDASYARLQGCSGQDLSNGHGLLVAHTLNAKGGSERGDYESETFITPNGGRGGIGVGAIQYRSAVRRLTPRECEGLQGFPDDYTLIPYRGKAAADGPRYKALGNSMAVPVMRWIGERIQMVERDLSIDIPLLLAV